ILCVRCTAHRGGVACGDHADNLGEQTCAGALLGFVKHCQRRKVVDQWTDNGCEEQGQGIGPGGAHTLAILLEGKIDQDVIEQTVNRLMQLVRCWHLWDVWHMKIWGGYVEQGCRRIVAGGGKDGSIGPENRDFN